MWRRVLRHPGGRRVGPLGQVIGVDLAARLLEIARGKAERNGLANVRFEVGDAAAELNVADYLGGGPLTSRELAAKAGTDALTLRRLLRALAAHGVFDELEPDRFSPPTT
jgi:hypothetical protein